MLAKTEKHVGSSSERGSREKFFARETMEYKTKTLKNLLSKFALKKNRSEAGQ